MNIALLNTDAHAKNVSLVHSGPGTVALAPLYDVAPTQWFLPSQVQAALPVGGKWRIDEIERRHLLGEARAWRMPKAIARSVIDLTIEVLANGTEVATQRFPTAPESMRLAVHAQIHRLRQSSWS